MKITNLKPFAFDWVAVEGSINQEHTLDYLGSNHARVYFSVGRKVWCAIVNERGTSDLGSLKNAKKHAEKEITKTINQRVELAKRWLDEYTRPTPTDTKGAVEVAANAIGRIVGQSDTDRDFASHIVNALIEQGYMQDWQPIETAPKDGTVINLLCEGVAHYGKWMVSKNVYKPDFSETFTWEGWQVRSYQDRQALSFSPTHWMPIPPSPDMEGTE